jgi:broad specificity phosphatase PhoE
MAPHEAVKELNLGECDGMTSTQVLEQLPKLLSQWKKNPSLITMPNGESLIQFKTRVYLLIKEVSRLHIPALDTRVIMIVNHSFARISLLCHILDMALSRFHKFQINLGSFTIIESSDEKSGFISPNYIAHLSNNETA